MNQSNTMNSGSSPSLTAKATEAALRLTFRQVMRPAVPLVIQRTVASVMKFAPLPKGVSCQPWPKARAGSEVMTPKSLNSKAHAVLYFHGGGFTICSPSTHRSLTSRIALESGLKTFAASYRLSPEAMFPAPQEDGLAAFDALVAEGYSPDNIIIAGDSAGGNLSLGVAQQIKARGTPMPKALVLISPVVDFTFSQVPEQCNDALLPENWAKINRWLYLTEEDTSNPLASPVLADFKGYPPVLVQSSSVEFLANDAERLVDSLKQAQVPVEWQVQSGLWHDYQMQAGVVPESNEAVVRIGRFIASQLAS